MKCPKCGTENEASFRFCMKCGTHLADEGEVQPSSVPSNPLQASTPPTSPGGYQPINQTPPPAQPPSYFPVYPTQPPPGPQYNNWAQPQPQPGGYNLPPQQQSSVMANLNIWGPFAGYGTRRKHIGWLMDNRGDRSPDLVTHVASRFKDRQIPGTNITQEFLTAKGILVETRPYFILRRGLASVALNITQFGRDLFVSLSSYLKPPISNFRVMLLLASILLLLYMAFGYTASLSGEFSRFSSSFTSGLGSGLLGGSSAPTPNTDSFVFLACIIGPLGSLNALALLIFFVFSIYKWMSEKDFFAGLRVQPNEFNEDDLMAMEKAVEQTVRQSIDDIGLDPADLVQVDPGTMGRAI